MRTSTVAKRTRQQESFMRGTYKCSGVSNIMDTRYNKARGDVTKYMHFWCLTDLAKTIL